MHFHTQVIATIYAQFLCFLNESLKSLRNGCQTGLQSLLPHPSLWTIYQHACHFYFYIHFIRAPCLQLINNLITLHHITASLKRE